MTAGPPRAEDRQTTEFPQRQIGHTGLRVTELGLGCATLGGSQIDVARAAAEEIVGAAWAAGVRYVVPRRITGSAKPSFASATRCATVREANGCSPKAGLLHPEAPVPRPA